MTRVLVTRAAEDAEALAEPLRKRGLEVVCVPLIERIVLPQPQLDGTFDWAVLTSPATVDALADAPPVRRIAAVGPGTARAARARGWTVDLVPETHTGEALVAALELDRRSRVFYPRAVRATPATALALMTSGASVTTLPVYDNVEPAGAREALAAALPVDLVPLMSASAARRLAALAPGLGSAVVVCIGPSTAEAARDAGLIVHSVAERHDLKGLIKATRRAAGV